MTSADWNGDPQGSLPSRFRFLTDILENSRMTVMRMKSLLTRKGVVVKGDIIRSCVVCMNPLDGTTFTYACTCGASYHSGCSMFSKACIRCDAPVALESGTHNCMWLPKIPVFGNGIDESLVSGFRCMYCDSAVSAEDAFCPLCGFHLLTVNGFICELCHCQVSPGSCFCHHCGTYFSAEQRMLSQCPCCQLVMEEGEECICGFRQ